MNANVAAVIVTYNSAREIGACLRALNGVGEIVVVDNASSDDTCERAEEAAPHAQLIRNNQNQGFAAAVNQGIRATSSPFVLLLNPDAALRTTLEAMVGECLSPRVGAACGRLADAGGQPQTGFNVRSLPTPLMLTAEVLLLNRLWPSNPLNQRYRRLDFDAARSQDVEQPAAAFLMVRRDALEKIGYLDEQFYPIWFEDVDLCLRLRRAGFTIRYTPSCVAEHEGGHSLRAMPLEQKHLAWYGNLLRFARKHYSAPAFLALWATVRAGLFLRWTASVLSGDSRAERHGYWIAMKSLRSRSQQGSRAPVNVGNTAESRSS
jgi:N-acetylglucosaminyl-diphospho-decaprenol L-rhamnosyltransferase